MTNHEVCERCEGCGADPLQPFHDADVRLCIECHGDGYVEVFEFRLPERLSA
jgi:DnaJ-class molecular chaperone